MITRFLVACAVLILSAMLAVSWMTGLKGSSPGTSPRGVHRDSEEIAQDLADTVKELSFEIGPRSFHRFGSLQRAANTVDDMLVAMGYTVEHHDMEVRGKKLSNLAVDVPGSTAKNQIVLLGAHYDSYLSSPGADCNGSGVAVLLELADRMRRSQPVRTIRFVFLANGERPWQGTEEQGSKQYAAFVKERGDSIELALLLDAVGYYSKEEGSQSFPFPLSMCYPKRGDFVAFFGTPRAKKAVQEVLTRWSTLASLPAEGGALPAWFPGIYGADHAAFADQGYTAILVTDTAENRWTDARTNYDACVQLDYPSMAALTLGLEALVMDVARSGLPE